MAAKSKEKRLRYSVSVVRQGNKVFYSLTMPSDVLARTCTVSTRKEDNKKGFQRVLDEKRAAEIANYIDAGLGTIPSSIVLSAQPNAKLKIIGQGKTLEFTDAEGAFLILDGQHRVYGFSKTSSILRVPVIIYNGLSRREESRLFIDINTKQRPVPPQLLLDIKQLADIESEAEVILRTIFDSFSKNSGSCLKGLMTAFETASNKINRVTFNQAVKPHLELFSDREASEIYEILNNYFQAILWSLEERTSEPLLTKPVVFRGFVGLFPTVAQRVSDKYRGNYSAENFSNVIDPLFVNIPMKKLVTPGTSWADLRKYLESRLFKKMKL